MEYLSKQRHDEIATELDYLINVVYPEVRENVAETSAQGDRSENAGYREARCRQAKTISRIRFLQKDFTEISDRCCTHGQEGRRNHRGADSVRNTAPES